MFLVFSLIGCGKAGKQHGQVSLSPAEQLRIATQGGQHLEVTEMAKEAAEFSQWQKLRRAGQARPFDEPDGAQAYFILKRLPDDQTALNGSTLIAAAEASKSLRLYSTAEKMFVTGANGPNLTWTPLGPGNLGGRTRQDPGDSH